MPLDLMISPKLERTVWMQTINLTQMKDRILRLFVASGCPDHLEGTVVLTDDEEIRELNRDWRGFDKPTDVLSFALQESEGASFAGELLGDIVISVETAARQMTSGQHRGRVEGDAVGTWDLEDEVVFLAIHGMLHLLGHDHAETHEEIVMRREERRLWKSSR